MITDHTLYRQLKNAYTSENLTKISEQILRLYHHKQYEPLRALASAIGVPEHYEGRQLLAKLMMLYHPDRLGHYQRSLESDSMNDRRLADIRHILIALRTISLFEADTATARQDRDPDLPEEEHVWEDPEEACDPDTPEDDAGRDLYYGENDNSFYTLFKKSMYGRTNIILPSCLLEDIDELELANRGIDSLEGLAYCRHLVTLDLSGNTLTNLEGMEGLGCLEELYVAENRIGYIDALSYLGRLRILDLSGNEVDDLSPLLELEHLELVNLSENPVPQNQIDLLKARGCLVLF